MRCKKHPADGSSAVGVCATCLRDRLLALMAAQAQLQVQVRDHSMPQTRRKSDTQLLPPQPPPFSCPETQPATSQPRHHHQRFYSTPLVGPAGVGIDQKKNRNSRKISSLFLRLFKSGSENPGTDPDPDSGSCTSSPLWFPTIIGGHRRKQSRTFSLEESSTGRGDRRRRRDRDRGMSPARCSGDEDEGGQCRGGSSGYSSESSQGWRQTPRRTPAAERRTAGHSRNVSGLAFCLSPLVRASPNRHWSQKGFPPEMVVVSGESRGLPTASFCKNRSRKLADFGRQSYDKRRR